MKRHLLIFAVLSLIGSQMAFSQMGPGGGGAGRGQRQGKGMGMPGIGAITNLTQEQEDRIFTIRQDLRKDVVALDVEADTIRRDLHRVMTAERLDERRANELHTRLQGVLTRISARQFEAHLAIARLLTTEQRAQLQDFQPRQKKGKPSR